jgi:hypothetical protein
MSKAMIYLVDVNHHGFFYFTNDAASLAKKCFDSGAYEKVEVEFDMVSEGADAAEELFELTNHPRVSETKLRYGNRRSVSVGDMVSVDGEFYLCRPTNWEKVSI